MTYNYTDISLGEFPGEISLILYSGFCICQCPWCFNPDLINKKPLSFKQAKEAIDEHLGFITALVLSGGEPILNPFFLKIINYAKSKGLKIKINTTGLVYENMRKNAFIPYVDYINISLKGSYAEYKKVLKLSTVYSVIPCCDTLEYSFVYSPTIWPQVYLKVFHDFLKDKIAYNWYPMCDNRWSQPDIFTISQMQTGCCLDDQYNSCRVPTQEECISVAKIFKDIPKKKVIVETKEFGRKQLNPKKI